MTSKMSTQEFEQFYERYKNILYRIAFTYLKNNADVEDILQEAFMKRLYHAPKFESEEHEKQWMIRITVNLCKNKVKSFWKRNVGSIEDMLDSLEVQQWELNFAEKEVLREVMGLPEKQRIVIYLHYFEGYSCKEIANILKKTESAAKMRLKKGREQLKVALQKA